MATDALREFTTAMDELVAADADAAARAAGAAKFLPELLAHPEFLSDEHRVGSTEHYTQHVVHVHESGAYSVVALVWLPGQRTPIHDHRCWCVVGVLQGAEREVRYHLVSDGADEWLTEQESQRNQPGSVSVLVPPEENIHLVENTCDGTAISIHVYGDDIATVGSSVNKVFTQEVRDDTGTAVGWRAKAAR
ncbi:MAG: cysteine dioxygenase [Streptosporangiales bacterium]|nr:cysteine dioxygenase [Streptosporangiales bacterium]